MAREPRPRRGLRTALRVVAALAGLVLLAIAVVWWRARPTTPDAFYDPPPGFSAQPGRLLRSERFERDVPAGARAWRVLYATTREDGVDAVASAIVVSPSKFPAGPRPVLAWAHGTTGVVPGCAPSVSESPFAYVPELPGVLARGWVFVATDYVGLGTKGPHPYLIGEGEARSVLDAVRAARQMEELSLGARTVVWGHSQGGHAAMWTGIVAPRYAPDVEIVGVAGIAPATDLVGLLREVQETPFGRIFSSYLVRAYTEIHADLDYDAIVRPGAKLFARDMAGRCLDERGGMVSAIEATRLERSIFRDDPTAGPLGARLAENVPDRPIEAPLLIVQGGADDLVLPRIQDRFVDRRCAAGQRLEYWTYPTRDHLSVLTPGAPLGPDLLRWTEERFAGVAQEPGCSVRPEPVGIARARSLTSGG